MGDWARRALCATGMILVFAGLILLAAAVATVVITLLAQGIAYITGFPERVSGLVAVTLISSLTGGAVAAILLGEPNQ